jgi:hypothetical protein
MESISEREEILNLRRIIDVDPNLDVSYHAPRLSNRLLVFHSDTGVDSPRRSSLTGNRPRRGPFG